MIKLTLSALIVILNIFTSCNVNPKKNTKTASASKSIDYQWLVGKKFVHAASKDIEPDLGGASFVEFISKELAILKIGDIAVDSPPKYGGEKITIADRYTNSEITFKIIDTTYLLDNYGGKWYVE
jgi:hypothetical protein